MTGAIGVRGRQEPGTSGCVGEWYGRLVNGAIGLGDARIGLLEMGLRKGRGQISGCREG